MFKSEIENEKNNFLNNKNEKIFNKISNIFQIINNFIDNKYLKKYKIIFNHKYILLVLLIIYFLFTLNDEIRVNEKKIEEDEIIRKGNRKYLKFQIINKFNSFLKLCDNNKLITIKKCRSNKKPKISAILPIYNGGKYLNNSLISIQNQNMKDIEIILIDDFSTDNTITIIEEYMKNDKRIRLIKNNRNKKILYSKSIGALNSKGEYIIQLDQDDMFIREDAFQILYSEAKRFNLDLVQMRDFVKKEFSFKKKTSVNLFGLHWIYPRNNHFKIQPELKETLFIQDNNYLLWGILIKSDLYKEAIYHLWPLIINYKIIFNEDYIITSMIANLAKSYKYLNKFILIHLSHSKSISSNYFKNNEFYLTLYFYIYYLYKYYAKNSSKNIKIIINFINRNLISFSKGKNIFPKMFDFIIKLLLNNDYLSFKEKKKLFKNLNVQIKKYNIFKTYKYMMNEKEYNNIIKFQILLESKSKVFSYYNNLIKRKYQISIIIYCKEFRFLRKTIYSILNQINNNEIIIIYDNNDETNLKYIKKLTNEYINIKLINNEGSKGIIYSYSIGILNANGEFILTLQPGYTLARENSLFSLYNSAKNYNLDILEFNLLINNKNKIYNNSLSMYKCLHYNSNKDLDSIKNNVKSQSIDQEKELLFNKLIKTNIFKKIISKYKLYSLNITIFNYYENIFIFLFNKYNLKFKHIDQIGIIQNKNNIEIIKYEKVSNSKNQLINDSLFYINFIFDHSNNTYLDKKFVFFEFINILSIIYNKFNKITNNSIKLIEKFINCKYINIEDKKELMFFYNSLIN